MPAANKTTMTGTGNEENTPQQKQASAEYIKLILIGQDSTEVHFMVKKSVSMGKLKAAYAERIEAPVKGVIDVDNTNPLKADSLRFLFNGRRVKDEDTPLSRKMKDGDSIEIYQETQLSAAECIKLKLIVIGQDSREWHFRVKYGTSMGKLKAAYAERIGVHADSFQFMFDGRRVKDGDTPQSRKMYDGNSINVVQP